MILSLDVGFKAMGWTVFDNKRPQACGVITTEKTKKKNCRTADDNAHRSSCIARELDEIYLKYQCKGIIGELPSGGAQSASAMAFMAMATAIVSSVVTLRDIPAEWTTPGEVKKAVCGQANAKKPEIMAAIIDRFGGNINVKTVKGRKGRVGCRYVYSFLDKAWPASTFEHIADACGAYLALREGNLVKLWG